MLGVEVVREGEVVRVMVACEALFDRRYRRSVLLRRKLRELLRELRELRAARKAIRTLLDGETK